MPQLPGISDFLTRVVKKIKFKRHYVLVCSTKLFAVRENNFKCDACCDRFNMKGDFYQEVNSLKSSYQVTYILYEKLFFFRGKKINSMMVCEDCFNGKEVEEFLIEETFLAYFTAQEFMK